ncbi:RsmD family RNA methyltransferase [Microbacterium rhizomatis]|uniref:RsmD family RNA methyltransferase n=1 Tax=Microbacterium rhizomatis TaxID=1631477 RepID=UPI00147830F9|nr:RsmD family RNA methyltransferase [Microbacterium rhizomatis]
MTRIIAGRAGSVTLEVPDAGTRPTSDRVRESLFGALESIDALRGAEVLDLYAGSGALALEAMSRGAASADLVEKTPKAAAAAERNAARVAKSLGSAAGPMRVHRASVELFLRAARGPYSLVFIDPPYDLAESELTGALIALGPSLHADAIVIVERARRSPAPDWNAADLHALRDRRYGDTTLWWGQPRPVSQSR